jgi:hypothetical protein
LPVIGKDGGSFSYPLFRVAKRRIDKSFLSSCQGF